MKILHVAENLSSRYGGPSKACQDMCRALAQRNHEVTLFTTDRDYPHGRLNVPNNIAVEQNNYDIWYFPTEFSSYKFSLSMARALQHRIKDFDIIHIHGLYRFPQAISAYYARKYQVPYVIRPHGSLLPRVYYQRKNRLTKRVYEYLVESKNLNRAAAIHFTTAEEMRSMPIDLKVPCAVIPIGVDLAEYENLPPKGTFKERYGLGDKRIILHLGRISLGKGLDILVKAFGQTVRDFEDAFLVLAGPDNEGVGAKVQEWIERDGLEKKVCFTGILKGIDKMAALSDAEVFVLPSYGESFGIAIIEAMACGLPVIISDKVNIWREVAAGGAGIVTRCDEDEVARELFALLSNEKSRQVIGSVGKKFVAENYDWDTIVDKLILFYESVT